MHRGITHCLHSEQVVECAKYTVLCFHYTVVQYLQPSKPPVCSNMPKLKEKKQACGSEVLHHSFLLKNNAA